MASWFQGRTSAGASAGNSGLLPGASNGGAAAADTAWNRRSVAMPLTLLDKLAQPPVPRPFFRYCGDVAFVWIAILLHLANVGISIVALLYEQQATLFPWGSLALSGFFVVWVLTFGEWALRYNQPLACYIHCILINSATWALLWVSIMNWTEVPLAQEYVEENWFQLQNTVLIPFTTLLDQKRIIYTWQLGLLVLGIICVVTSLAPVAEAWSSLGGFMRLVQTRFGVLIPEYIVLIILCALTIFYTNYAATFSAWADVQGTSVLLWQSACAGLGVIALAVTCIAAGVWGVTFLTHALGAIMFAPLSFIVLVTSSVTLSRATTMQGFVHDNWDDLKMFVPPAFSALPPEKYSLACYDAATAAGGTGLMLAFLFAATTYTHIRCTAILASVGRQLTLLTAERATASYHREAVASTRSEFAPITASGEVGVDKAPLLPGAADRNSTSLASPTSNYGTSNSGAGARPEAPSSFTTLPLNGDGTTIRAARKFMMHSVKLEELQLGNYTEEMVLERDVQWLSARAFFADVVEDTKTAWASFQMCVILTAVVCVVCIGGMAGALAVVGKLGECSVLVPGAGRVEVTYTLWQEARNDYYVELVNNFDRGSIEMLEPMSSNNGKGNFSIEVTYYAAKGVRLPSYDEFVASINFTQPIPNDDFSSDDLNPAYAYSSVVVSPPDSISKNCYAARLRVTTRASYLRASIRSRSAMVNVTGDLGNVLDIINKDVPPPSKATFSRLNVTTDSGAILVSNTWGDLTPSDEYAPPVQNGKCSMTGRYIPPLFNLISTTGSVTLDNSIIPGGRVDTGGDIRTSSLISALVITCVGIAGNVTVQARGSGRIGVSQGFAAANAYISSDSGVISISNAGMLIADRLDIVSNNGKIYLANFIQATGNQTFVSSNADISLSAVFANYLVVNALNKAKLTAYVVYLGLTELPDLFYPSLGTYVPPALVATTDISGMTVVSFGGSPSNATYANKLSADLRSNYGDVKMELNGGGYNGNYTVVAANGVTFVELVGVLASDRGVIGVGSTGYNNLYMYSNRGDVQLSLLASPL